MYFTVYISEMLVYMIEFVYLQISIEKTERGGTNIQSEFSSRREKLRELWRNAQLKYRIKKKNLQGIMNLTPETSFNQEVEVQPDPVPVHYSTPEHPVSAQNQERPQTPSPPSAPSSPPESPSPWRVEINKLTAQLRQQRNKNKVLIRRVNIEQGNKIQKTVSKTKDNKANSCQ